MATLGWRSDPSLSQILAQQYRQFNLLQLVRLWLRRGERDGVDDPGDALRFRADLGAAFPGHPVSGVSVRSPGAEQLRIATPDFCIASALGPLPEPFVEWVREQEANGRTATRDFLDLFNHRLNLLRWRMRAAFEPGLNNLPPEQTPLADQLAALMGLAAPGGKLRLPLPLPRRSWLGIGGLLNGVRRSAVGLSQVLSAHLGCPVRVEPMVGAWRSIEAQDQHLLGLGGRRLGQDTLLGRRVWDCQQRVRLHIGPLGFDQAQRLLPPRRAHDLDAAPVVPADEAGTRCEACLHPALVVLVRLMLSRRQDAEIVIQVHPASVPPSVPVSTPGMDAVARPRPGLRLGQTAWLQRQREGTPHELRFLIPAHEPSPGRSA